MLTDLGLTDARWPWAPALVIVGVVALLLLPLMRARRSTSDPAVVVAHTARLRSLGRYRAMVKHRRTLGLLFTSAALLVVAGSALVLARPQAQSIEGRTERGRDLILCLDASASMDVDNRAVAGEIRRIVSDLQGDRVGMVIWSGAAVQVFPLTDDYEFVEAQLDRAEAAFDHGVPGFFTGIDTAAGRSSIIGDGIVSCVNRFDANAPERTRALILASDNDPRGTGIYSLADAAAYAAKRKVLIYSIGAASLARTHRAAALQELSDATTGTGGTFELLGSAEGAERIVTRINDLEKARATEPPRPVAHDAPYAGMVVCAVGAVLLCLAWAMSWRSARARRKARQP